LFTDLEACDGLLRLGDDGLLAGDLGQIAHGVFKHLLVGHSLAHAHVERDLGQARDLHRGLVAELLGQVLGDLFAVVLLESCHVRTS